MVVRILRVIKEQEIDLNHEGTHASAQLLLSSLPPSLKLELLALIGKAISIEDIDVMALTLIKIIHEPIM